MDAWVGPAIVAAVISGLVSLIVVQLNFRGARKADRLRRAEKVRDIQIALRAEIRSELMNLRHHAIDAAVIEVTRRYAEESGYSVSVPRPAKHIVFEAIVGEIHILPERVIDPIVLYVRQRQAVERLVEDMRDSSFKTLSRDRQLAMYEDYARMWTTWRDLAEDAEAALNNASDSIARTRTGLSGDGLGLR
jgi:hypothetical protein